MASLYAQKSLRSAQAELVSSAQALSSGKRINSAKDDVAGIGKANSVLGIQNIMDRSSRNIQSAISLVQTAETSLDVVNKILNRALTLVQQKNDPVLTTAQKSSIDAEVNGLFDQIDQISNRTTFNGSTSIFGKRYLFGNGSQTDTQVNIAELGAAALGLVGGITPSNFSTYIPSASDNYTLSQLGTSSNSSYVADTGFVKFTVNGMGSGALGNGSSSPGLMFDPSGNSNFGVEDYISPGTPFEGYSVVAGANTIKGSNEASVTSPATKIWRVDPTTNEYVVLRGSQSTGFVTLQYMAKQGEPVIRMKMSYTNTTGSNQTVSMMRGMDPDVDVKSHNSYASINTLGAPGIPTTDLVNSIGTYSGKALSLYIPGDGYTHQVAIISSWPDYNPSHILAGGAASDSVTPHDWAIEGAWNIGTVANGQTVSVDAYYIAGTNIQQSIDLLAPSTRDMTIAQMTSNIQSAIQQNASNRTDLGIQLNQLNYQIDSLQTLTNDLKNAYNQIMDVDYAIETSKFTSKSMSSQAAASILAQANQSPRVVLALMDENNVTRGYAAQLDIRK
jgi:flagellin-like hook-associated protein FlgL